MFALRDRETKKLVGFYYTVDADYRDNTAETTFTLSFDDDNVWVTAVREYADNVVNKSYAYYGSYNYPCNPYNGRLEVVELTLRIDTNIEQKLELINHTLTTKEAMQALIEGKKLTKEKWHKNKYIHLVDGQICNNSKDGAYGEHLCNYNEYIIYQG